MPHGSWPWRTRRGRAATATYGSFHRRTEISSPALSSFPPARGRSPLLRYHQRTNRTTSQRRSRLNVRRFELALPDSLEACQQALADGSDIKVVAGGTDLLPQMKNGV